MVCMHWSFVIPIKYRGIHEDRLHSENYTFFLHLNINICGVRLLSKMRVLSMGICTYQTFLLMNTSEYTPMPLVGIFFYIYVHLSLLFGTKYCATLSLLWLLAMWNTWQFKYIFQEQLGVTVALSWVIRERSVALHSNKTLSMYWIVSKNWLY